MEPQLIKKELKPIENKIDEIIKIQNNLNANAHKIELEKSLEEIYTYIDIKFEEQEVILSREIKKELNLIKNTSEAPIKKEKNIIFKEKIILTIKAIILIILNFLVIFLIIWLLYNFNSYDEVILKTIDTFNEFNNGNNENKGIKNWILKKILKFLLYLIIQIISIYSFYFPFSKPSNNENIENSGTEFNYNELNSIFNELFENHEIISDILDNISVDLNENEAYNILDQLNSEYNKREEMLSKIEYETEKILDELESNDLRSFPSGVESTNNVLDPNNKDKIFDLGRSLITSASILGSSMIISNIIPTLLEFTLR